MVFSGFIYSQVMTSVSFEKGVKISGRLMLVVRVLGLRSRTCIPYSRLGVRHMYGEIKPVQTMDEIRERGAILLNDRACEPICWAGVYGSFSRSTHTSESDIDMIIGYNPDSTPEEVYQAADSFVQQAPDAFGRQVEVIHMMTQKVETYLLLEALLTCVTMYGPENWPAKSQEDSRKYLDEGFQRLKEAYLLLQQIQDQIDKTTKDVLPLWRKHNNRGSSAVQKITSPFLCCFKLLQRAWTSV